MVRITCSILCYNYGRFLGQAIESCLHQTPGDYAMDILVIDDGSTDETPEVCTRYASKIRVVRSGNEGFGSSLTKAVKLAEGEYVCLLDADDYFHPNKLRTLLPLMGKHALLITHGFAHVDSSGERIDDHVHPGVATSSVCLQKKAAMSLLPVSNERHFFPLDQPGRSAYLPEALTFYRKHPGSMQRNPKAGVWQSELATVNRQFIAQIDELLRHPPRWMVSTKRLEELRRESEVIIAFSELEAALQLHQRHRAFSRYGKFLWTLLSQGHFTFQIPKMLIRTLLGRPTFATDQASD